MLTRTAEVIDDKKDLMQAIELLSNRAVLRVKGYIERIREEELEREAEEEERRYQSMTVEEIHAEIAALEEKHGTTPNAETIAAMREAEAGLGEEITIDQLKAQINAYR